MLAVQCSNRAEHLVLENLEEFAASEKPPRRSAAPRHESAAAGPAAVRASARDLQQHTGAVFFRARFARRLRYASFESWKSSFAKLAEHRVELSSGVFCGRPEKALSWSSSLQTAYTSTSPRR